MLNIAGEMKVGFVKFDPEKNYARISVYKAVRPRGMEQTQLLKMTVMVFGKHAPDCQALEKGDVIFVVGELRPNWFKRKDAPEDQDPEMELVIVADKVDSFGIRKRLMDKHQAPTEGDAPAAHDYKPTVLDDDIPF